MLYVIARSSATWQSVELAVISKRLPRRCAARNDSIFYLQTTYRFNTIAQD
jgi:hypothetical protein